MKNLLSTALTVGGIFFNMLCSAQSVDGKIGDHDYVDLGLPSGAKWATCNVGATKPTEPGHYIAWGEKKPRKVYDIDNHKWAIYDFEKQVDKYVKYIPKDGLTDLEAKDDAVRAQWGKLWHLPNKDEYAELAKGCTWEYVENYNNSGVAGVLGTSKENGHTIFLPEGGAKGNYPFIDSIYYWTASVCNECRDYRDAWAVNFEGGNLKGDHWDRFYGFNCRGVAK